MTAPGVGRGARTVLAADRGVPALEPLREVGMGRLTTHVLDTSLGRPGAGIEVTVYRIGDSRVRVASAFTNADGRTDRPLLEGDAFTRSVYEIEFGAGAYFIRSGATLPDPPFVGNIVLRFGVANSDEHYHVPLLVSPWSYSTYRGG